MVIQKASARIRSRMKRSWLCCSAPRCSARRCGAHLEDGRAPQQSRQNISLWNCFLKAQHGNSSGGKAVGSCRTGKISCSAGRQISPQPSIALSSSTAAVYGECQVLGASSPCTSHVVSRAWQTPS